MRSARRMLVAALAAADAGVDEIVYRPAVVKAFLWFPRWWNCDLAKLSISLDNRWATGYWTDDSIYPGPPCAACGRRASIHVYGGLERDEEPTGGDFMEEQPVHTCGWCHLRGAILTEEDLARELAAARADSIAWRWRWRVRP